MALNLSAAAISGVDFFSGQGSPIREENGGAFDKETELVNLPDDALFTLTAFLELCSLLRLSLTCRRLRSACVAVPEIHIGSPSGYSCC